MAGEKPYIANGTTSDPREQTRKFPFKVPSVYYSGLNKGYIYVVKVGDYFKIGRTFSPKNRLKSYNGFPPFKSEVILVREVEDCKFVERQIQSSLKKYQVMGEWFDIPKTWDKDYKSKFELIVKTIEDCILEIKKNKNESTS